MKKEQKTKKIRKVNYKKIANIIKMILIVLMLGLSYTVSNKLIDYILTLDADLLKRLLNIVIVAIIVFLAVIKKDEK